VAGVIARLTRRPEPLVQLVERRPGQREERFVHLLGPREIPEISDEPAGRSGSSAERILALEVETANLRRELTGLRQWLEDLLGERKTPPDSAAE
jgi:hypothetical protein